MLWTGGTGVVNFVLATAGSGSLRTATSASDRQQAGFEYPGFGVARRLLGTLRLPVVTMATHATARLSESPASGGGWLAFCICMCKHLAGDLHMQITAKGSSRHDRIVPAIVDSD